MSLIVSQHRIKGQNGKSKVRLWEKIHKAFRLSWKVQILSEIRWGAWEVLSRKVSASGLYLETLSLAALGEMGWWKNGKHGAREPH